MTIRIPPKLTGSVVSKGWKGINYELDRSPVTVDGVNMPIEELSSVQEGTRQQLRIFLDLLKVVAVRKIMRCPRVRRRNMKFLWPFCR